MRISTHYDPIKYILIEDVFEESTLLDIKNEIDDLKPHLFGAGLIDDRKDITTGLSLCSASGISITEDIDLDKSIIYANTEHLINALPNLGLPSVVTREQIHLHLYNNSDYFRSHSNECLTAIYSYSTNDQSQKLCLSDFDMFVELKDNSCLFLLQDTKHSISDIIIDGDNSFCTITHYMMVQ